MKLKPSEIFYSQDSILNTFGDYTYHRHTYLGETLDQLLTGECNVNSIEPISVIERNRKWFTADNRRLWVFRKAEEIGFLQTIPVKKTYYIDPRKLTTINEGKSIEIRRGNPGGSVWRTWKPPDLLRSYSVSPRVTNYNLNKTNVFSTNYGYKTNPPVTANNVFNQNSFYNRNNGSNTIINVRQYSEANTSSRHEISCSPSPVEKSIISETSSCISRHSSRESPISYSGSNIRTKSPNADLRTSFDSNTNRNDIQQFNLSYGSSYSRYSSRKSPISFIGSNITTQSPKTSFISNFGNDQNRHIIQQFNVSQISSNTVRSSPAQIPNTNDISRMDSFLSNASNNYPSENAAHLASTNSLSQNIRHILNTSDMSYDSRVTGNVAGSKESNGSLKQEKPKFNYAKELSKTSSGNIVEQDHSLTMARERQSQGVSPTTNVYNNKRHVGCCSIL